MNSEGETILKKLWQIQLSDTDNRHLRYWYSSLILITGISDTDTALLNLKKTTPVKGATKSYFVHYTLVVIILFIIRVCNFYVFFWETTFSVFHLVLCLFCILNFEYFYILNTYLVSVLKVHWCRFENFPICLCSYKNTILKISYC